LTAIIYITIVLTAMQVGLASEELMHNRGFNRAAYGFTVFSILAPLIVLLLGFSRSGRAFLRKLEVRKEKKGEGDSRLSTGGCQPQTPAISA
jgi:hypothetical protein